MQLNECAFTSACSGPQIARCGRQEPRDNNYGMTVVKQIPGELWPIRSVSAVDDPSPVYSGLVTYFESAALINARSSTVWEVITDADNFTVWESGIIAVDGELRNGGTIRIKTTDPGRRSLRLRVQQMPGEVMTWTDALPFGLIRRIRTFTLSPRTGLTHLTVKEEVSGPLVRLLGSARSDTAQTLNDYVNAVRRRAELLDRSL